VATELDSFRIRKIRSAS